MIKKILSIMFVSSVAVAANPKQITCSSDALPDGNKEDIILTKNSDNTYKVTYQKQEGGMEEGPSDEVTTVTLATGLRCIFGPKNSLITNCKKKDRSANVVSYFAMNAVSSVSVELVGGEAKEFTHDSYEIMASSPEMEAGFGKDTFPEDVSKHGLLTLSFLEGECEITKK